MGGEREHKIKWPETLYLKLTIKKIMKDLEIGTTEGKKSGKQVVIQVFGTYILRKFHYPLNGQ